MININKVHQMDAIQLLNAMEDDSIDALITDPPYSSGGMTSASRKLAPEKKYISSEGNYKTFADDNRDRQSQEKWLILWLNMPYQKVKDGGMVCVFSNWRQLSITADALQMAGYVWLGIFVWDKTQIVRQ